MSNEEKFEEPEPRRTKLNRELANILSGNTYEEKLETANSLQIEATEHVGKFNPFKGQPIAVKFASKNDAEMVLKNKKKLSEGIFVDRLYSTETEKEHKRLRPILSAACRLEEYHGKCKMEGTDLIIHGKPQNLSPEVVSCHQDATHYGFFGEFNPLSSIQLFSHIMVLATVILNNSSKPPKWSSGKTLKLLMKSFLLHQP